MLHKLLNKIRLPFAGPEAEAEGSLLKTLLLGVCGKVSLHVLATVS